MILTGGTLRKNSFSLVGPLAEQTLRQLSADILFLGVDGFDTRAGLFTPNILEAQVNRIMVEISSRKIAVCDSSKFGRRSLCNIMPSSAVDQVITDKSIGKHDLEVLESQGSESLWFRATTRPLHDLWPMVPRFYSALCGTAELPSTAVG